MASKDGGVGVASIAKSLFWRQTASHMVLKPNTLRSCFRVHNPSRPNEIHTSVPIRVKMAVHSSPSLR